MSSSLDSFRLPRLGSLSGADRFDTLSDVIGQAEEQGVLNHLPENDAPAQDQEAVASRTVTVRTQLYLLGYLARDNGLPILDPRLRDAIGTFQQEAGLPVNQQVGEDTWVALQELVSFEVVPNLERWFENDTPRRPLRQATEVRLNVLGMMDSRHPRKQSKVQAALEDFVDVATLLELTPEPLVADGSRATLAALFDQGTIAKRLSGAEEAMTVKRPSSISSARAQSLMRRFIIAAAKIELWLTGYDLPLGRNTPLKVPPRFPYPPARYPLFHTLYSFWRDCGESKTRARESASTITGALFRRLLTIEEQAAETSDDAATAQLYTDLTTAKVKDRLAVWAEMQRIGSRIWDGIKRAWRWLKSLITRGVRKATAWIKNMARITYRYASNAFDVVRRAVKAGVGSIRFMLHKTVPGSDPDQIVISHDNDFDYRLFVHRDSDPAKVDALTTEFTRQARLFTIMVQLLGSLLKTLVEGMRKTAFGGWFGFVIALFQLRNQRGLVRELVRLSGEREALP